MKEIEDEIKDFVSSEDGNIKEQYEISDSIEDNAVSDEIVENTQPLE